MNVASEVFEVEQEFSTGCIQETDHLGKEGMRRFSRWNAAMII
jgi:hypothetical protein